MFHNGGSLEFGADGLLYVGTGEDTQGSPAQNLDDFRGKVLRITTDGNPAPGNPFTGSAARSRVWAFGLRNPFRFALRPGPTIPCKCKLPIMVCRRSQELRLSPSTLLTRMPLRPHSSSRRSGTISRAALPLLTFFANRNTQNARMLCAHSRVSPQAARALEAITHRGSGPI
jgi:hypothetical protein